MWSKAFLAGSAWEEVPWGRACGQNPVMLKCKELWDFPRPTAVLGSPHPRLHLPSPSSQGPRKQAKVPPFPRTQLLALPLQPCSLTGSSLLLPVAPVLPSAEDRGPEEQGLTVGMMPPSWSILLRLLSWASSCPHHSPEKDTQLLSDRPAHWLVLT